MIYALSSDLLSIQSKIRKHLQQSSIVYFDALTVDESSRQKINKEMLDFNSRLEEAYITCSRIYALLKYTPTFSERNDKLGHKISQ